MTAQVNGRPKAHSKWSSGSLGGVELRGIEFVGETLSIMHSAVVPVSGSYLTMVTAFQCRCWWHQGKIHIACTDIWLYNGVVRYHFDVKEDAGQEMGIAEELYHILDLFDHDKW